MPLSTDTPPPSPFDNHHNVRRSLSLASRIRSGVTILLHVTSYKLLKDQSLGHVERFSIRSAGGQQGSRARSESQMRVGGGRVGV